MKPIIFEVGQKVICAPDCTGRSGQLGIVTGGLTLRMGFGNDGRTALQSYRVQWADGDTTPATQSALEPAPPERGDMDTVVGWCWFDPDLEKVIKGEKK